MKLNKNNFLVLLFFVAVLSYPYFVLYGPFGLSRALWGLAFLTMIEVTKYVFKVKFDYRQYLFFPIAIAVSLAWFLRDDAIIFLLNHILASIVFALHLAVSADMLKGQYFEQLRPDKLLIRVLKTLAVPLKADIRGDSKLKNNISAIGKNAPKIIIGIVFASVVGIVVFGLLASADEVFFNIIISALENIISFEFILKIMFSLVVMLIAFAIFRGSLKTNLKEFALYNYKRKHDVIIFGLLIYTLNLIYLIFSAVQIEYLVSGEEFARKHDITFSEYAVSGFWEMIFVVMINLVVTAAAVSIIKLKSDLPKKILRPGLVLMNIASLVMIYSSHIRLLTYEISYGYTINRLIPHLAVFILMIVTLVMFAVIFIKKSNLRSKLAFHNLWWGLNISLISLLLIPMGIVAFELNLAKASNESNWENDINYSLELLTMTFENHTYVSQNLDRLEKTIPGDGYIKVEIGGDTRSLGGPVYYNYCSSVSKDCINYMYYQDPWLESKHDQSEDFDWRKVTIWSLSHKANTTNK